MSVFDHAEETFGPAFSLHGKTVSGTWQMGPHEFGLLFTDGTELCVHIEEDHDSARLRWTLEATS